MVVAGQRVILISERPGLVGQASEFGLIGIGINTNETLTPVIAGTHYSQRVRLIKLNPCSNIHASLQKPINIPSMSSTTGTMRGTPSRSGAARGAMPQFTNSPSSGIPRPLETHGSSTLQSEAGGSSVSTSRQKQSKRDEVCLPSALSQALREPPFNV